MRKNILLCLQFTGSQVEVLGTSFNVEAYEESPEVSTTLIKGKVNFSFQEGVRKKQIVLEPRSESCV